MTKAKHLNPNMVEGPLFVNIVRYTLPVIVTGILQLLFNAADLVVVGQLCGSISVAAVGATGSITNLLVNFFVGLSVGVGIAVSQALGAKDDEQVHRTVHATPPILLICGIIVSVVGVLFAETFLQWMGTPPDVLALSTVYMRIIFAGTPFSLAYNFFAAILRATGETKKPMIYLTLSGIVNVVLNLFFVISLKMNVAGVALATILSQALSAVLVFLALIRRTDACRLCIHRIRFYWGPIKKILTLGIPASIQSCMFSISNVIIQSSINSFGQIAMSGNAAAQNIDGFIYIALNGFYHAALNFTGQNAGAKQYDRIKRIIVICSLCSIVTGLVLGTIVWLLGPHLLGIYITDSTDAIAYGMIRLTFIGLPYFGCGLMEVASGVLRGIGASFTSMLLSIAGVCGVRIMWIYTIFQLPAFHSLPVLYLSYIVSWLLTSAGMWIAFMFLYQKHKKIGIA